MIDRQSRRAGFTLLELVIVVAIVGILAAAVLPIARWSIKRQNEHELQQNLRILRDAIDRYHDLALAGLIEVGPGETGYPPDLELLVDGVELTGAMPSPLPGVSDAYSATGLGLTGGFAGAAAAAGAAGGDPSAAPGGAAGLGAQRQPGALGSALSRLQDPTNPLSQRLTPSQRTGLSRLRDGMLGGAAGSRPSLGGLGARGAVARDDRGAADRGRAADRVGVPEKIIFLRRIPVDPLTGEADWGLRCYGDDIQDQSWCGRDVFDVYSISRGRGIDGRPYRQW